MKFQNKMFPHPVLDAKGKDFSSSSFRLNIELLEAKENLKLGISFKLKNKGIEDLIDAGLAGYFLHIESESTRHRETVLLGSKAEKEIIVSSKDLGSRVEVAGGVIALDLIPHYINDSFVDELQGIPFSINPGELLAAGEDQELLLEKEDSLAGLPSIFAVVENQDESVTSPSWISDDQILIKLPKKQFESYALLSQTPSMREVLINMFVVPVLVDVLSRFKGASEEDFNEEKDSEWGRLLLDRLEELDIDLETEDDLFSASFRVLDSLEIKALENLQRILDEES